MDGSVMDTLKRLLPQRTTLVPLNAYDEYVLTGVVRGVVVVYPFENIRMIPSTRGFDDTNETESSLANAQSVFEWGRVCVVTEGGPVRDVLYR
jgi:hypothetical protein